MEPGNPFFISYFQTDYDVSWGLYMFTTQMNDGHTRKIVVSLRSADLFTRPSPQAGSQIVITHTKMSYRHL